MNDLILRIKDFISRYQVYIKSSFLYLFPSIFSAVIRIAINPLMAKNLSPEDYAVMGYFNSFTIIILPILSFSLFSYYLRHYYLLPENRRQIVSDTILVALLVYSFLALALVAVSYYLYWKWSKVSFPFFPYALLTFIPIYFDNFLTMYLIKCRMKREAGKYSKIVIFNSVLNTLLSVFLVIIYKYGATGRLWSILIASVVTAIYSFKKMFGKFQFDWTIIKDALRFGWPLSLSGILWYFFSGVDSALLEQLKDSYTFGFYNVAGSIATYFFLFYTAISQTFEPDIYKAIAENKSRKIVKIIGGIIILNAIPNILFIIFAPTVIGLLTYNRYLGSADFARILALKNITLSIYYSFITIVVGYGFTKSQLIILIIGSFISIIMYKLLISYFGFYGAAWGQVLSFLILAFVVILFLFYKLNLSFKDGHLTRKTS